MEARPRGPAEGLSTIIESALSRSEPLVPVGEDSARRLRELIDGEDTNSTALCALVSSECGFAAEILRAAHSPLFGGLPALREVEGAIERLGSAECLALLARAAERARAFLSSPWARPKVAALVLHARECAYAASWLARRAGLAHLSESALLVGLLHDIGKLVLVRAVDDLHGAMPDDALQTLLAEEHGRVGARLLADWNLPPDMVDAIERHHDRTQPRDESVLVVLLRLADHASHRAGRAPGSPLPENDLLRHLDALGLSAGALDELCGTVLLSAVPA